MSTATAAVRGARPTRIKGRQTFGRTVASEWIKLRSLTSTWVTSAIAVLVTVFFGAATTIGTANTATGEGDIAATLTSGVTFGYIVMAVLGALIITGEYSSGQIRSSLAAVPHRWRLFWGKTVVITLWGFLIGAVSVLLAWVISTPFTGDYSLSFTDVQAWGLVWGSGLSVAGITLLAMGMGFLMRSTAGSITVVVCLLFVILAPLQIASARWEWAGALAKAMPASTAQAVNDPLNLANASPSLGPSHGLAMVIFLLWVLTPLALGWIAFSRRDA